MKKCPKTCLEVDPELLAPYIRVAEILGVPFRRYVETYLEPLLNDLSPDPVQHIAFEMSHQSYQSRELAEAAAGRLEAYAIEQKLEGNAAASVICTEVAEYQAGFWRVKVNHLTRFGWRVVAADLWEDDNDEGEEWKGEA
jgi:hypothetical protein